MDLAANAQPLDLVLKLLLSVCQQWQIHFQSKIIFMFNELEMTKEGRGAAPEQPGP